MKMYYTYLYTFGETINNLNLSDFMGEYKGICD